MPQSDCKVIVYKKSYSVLRINDTCLLNLEPADGLQRHLWWMYLQSFGQPFIQLFITAGHCLQDKPVEIRLSLTWTTNPANWLYHVFILNLNKRDNLES